MYIQITIKRHDDEGRYFWRVIDTDDDGEVYLVGCKYEVDERTAKLAAAAAVAGYMVHGKVE